MTAQTPRRTLLVAAASGAAAALAGCTVYGRENDSPAAEPDGSGTAPAESGESSGGEVLASTSDVDVGGGVILPDRGVVVTQPSDGAFKGFSSTCTHQGCTVSSISDGTINCACHGSRFSIEDGSVVQAASGLTPDAQAPLPEVPISVDGDSILAG
ncbi:MAG TPA: Rieske (2Fe-2S) protein [Jiangellaceae bacterium]